MDRREQQQQAREQAAALAALGITAHPATEGLWIDVSEADKLIALLAASPDSPQEG
ncbi:hypothetical protein [Nonomuraea sp. NPDC001023]|uniref:hypothetical protein n=1 Tax=unclassified Nonomuraea TaxID=2593643 RepID=UPI00332028BA